MKQKIKDLREIQTNEIWEHLKNSGKLKSDTLESDEDYETS